MPTDAAVASRISQKSPDTLPRYYGFDPALEYVVRSRSRVYNGTAQQVYRFNGGECIVGRMSPNATEDQKWNRGERLKNFDHNFNLGPDGRKYAVYIRGEEPLPHEEPMWFGQEVPEEDSLLEEFGEERYEPAEGVQAEAQRFDSYVTDPEPTGESTPTPKATIKEFNPASGKIEDKPVK